MLRHFLRRRLTTAAVPTANATVEAALGPTETAQKSAIIAQLTKNDVGRRVRIQGWIKSRRTMKSTVFVDINDGSGPQNLQVTSLKEQPSTATNTVRNTKNALPLSYGASVRAEGVLSLAPSGQLELKADQLNVIGACPLQEGYPIVPKQQHPPEYLREFLHLRPRATPIASIMRIRDDADHAFRTQLRRGGFRSVSTPIITTNDCEGGGETFAVQPNSQQLLKSMQRNATLPLEQSYFDKPASLTVSSQLHLEAAAYGLGNVYSFGPIFRAENSKTATHLAEFHMLEAEQTFVCGVADICTTIERLLKAVTEEVLASAEADLSVVARTAKMPANYDWLRRPFPIVTYAEAVAILTEAGRFSEAVETAERGLSKEQELWLVQHLGGMPVFVVEWPKRMKPFYMRPLGGNGGDLVEAIDLLVPFVGELCGGGVREDDHARLSDKLPAGSDLEWYAELRKFGGITTGGFGMGFERYLQWVLGMPNIKDVIMCPRWAHNCAM